jgi:hypothetical protein
MTTADLGLKVSPVPQSWFARRPLVRTAFSHLAGSHLAGELRGPMRRPIAGGTPTAGMLRMITLLAGLAAVAIAAVMPVSWFIAA